MGKNFKKLQAKMSPKAHTRSETKAEQGMAGNAQEDWDCHLTVGDLRKAMAGLPDEMPVFYHRIEDIYFNEYGWTATEIESGEKNGGWDKGWIRAFSAFVPSVKGKRKKILCLTAHY